MGDNKEWQSQLLGAALMAAARTAIEYVTNPEARDETVQDVRAKLAEVDYNAAARALSKAIDQFAESSKSAVSEAIDSLRENADQAVEIAAEKAQAQLGPKRRGRGKMFFGILLGIGLGFILLNEDRRNQLMDRLTGATGPVDSSQWSTVASNVKDTPSDSSTSAPTIQDKLGDGATTPPASPSKSGDETAAKAPTDSPSASAKKSAATENQDTEKIPVTKNGQEKAGKG